MRISWSTGDDQSYVTMWLFSALFVELVVRANTQTVFGIFVVVIVLIQSANVTDLFWAENRRQENDEVMMTRMTSEIAELAGAWIPKEPVIIFSDTSYENYDYSLNWGLNSYKKYKIPHITLARQAYMWY